MGSFHEADQITGHRGKRDFRARFKTPQFDTLVVHNDRGFRRQEYQNPTSSAAHSLFVFGDSFVWGWERGIRRGFSPINSSRKLPQVARREPGH